MASGAECAVIIQIRENNYHAGFGAELTRAFLGERSMLSCTQPPVQTQFSPCSLSALSVLVLSTVLGVLDVSTRIVFPLSHNAAVWCRVLSQVQTLYIFPLDIFPGSRI